MQQWSFLKIYWYFYFSRNQIKSITLGYRTELLDNGAVTKNRTIFLFLSTNDTLPIMQRFTANRIVSNTETFLGF